MYRIGILLWIVGWTCLGCSSTPVVFDDGSGGVAGDDNKGAADVTTSSGGVNRGGGGGASGGADKPDTGGNRGGGGGASGGADEPDTGGNQPAACSQVQEGELRCGAALGQREVCEGGQWRATNPCPSGEACTATEPAGAAGCASASTLCDGKAGQAVCDDQGVMHSCDMDGVVARSNRCDSVELCRQGLESGACAICLDGERRCVEQDLQVCRADGSSYETQETCQTAALCNAQAGRCTAETCAAGDYFCKGKTLQSCNAEQTGFEDVEACVICDEENGQCDTCASGDTRCTNDVLFTCDAEGSAMEQTPCPSATPHCTGTEPDAVCVQCREDGDCTGDPGTCRKFTCNRSTGACEAIPDPEGKCTILLSRGVCTNSGTCVECERDTDCVSNERCNLLNACEPIPRCGDGIIQAELGEQCDDGNTNNFDRCDTSCLSRDYFVSCTAGQPCGSDITGVCFGPAVSNFAMCFPICANGASCPTLPGTVPLGGSRFAPVCDTAGGACYIPCGILGSCPAGMSCYRDHPIRMADICTP